MRKAFYLAFCLTVALGLSCITDYEIITDNNQITGKRAGGVQPVINTRGKAHITEFFQWATLWPDGSDNLMSFIDQRADGTAVLTTFNNFSTGAEPTFHDDLYCNTDRQGCAVFTAPDNNDNRLYDGVLNSACSGARSLLFLLASGRYYGECGRMGPGRLGVEDQVRLINLGRWAKRYGMEGFLYPVDLSNLSITLTDQTGYSEILAFSGAAEAWRSGQHNYSTLNLTDARFGQMLTGYASWLERRDPEATEVTLRYNGIPLRYLIGQNKEQGIDYRRVLERRNAAY